MRKLFSKKEIKIILILLVVAVFGLLYNNTKKTTKTVGKIQYNGDKIIDVNLSMPQQIIFPSNPNVIIEVREDKSIGFIASDCPDKICINTGFIKTPGKSAACLPNKVLVFVEDAEENDDIPDITV